MIAGTVKFFDRAKGFGIIVPDGAGPEAFVDGWTVECAGLAPLCPEQRVDYEIAIDRGKVCAVGLSAAGLDGTGAAHDRRR